MSDSTKNVNLDAVLRKAQRRTTLPDTPEDKLDTLLDLSAKLDSESDSGDGPVDVQCPLDRLRLLFREELVPAFEELRGKYEAKGVQLAFNAVNFLGGGREITVTLEFRGVGLRLVGTVMPNSIAFHQARYTAHDPAGLAGSGPNLRTRDLNAQTFRTFVCDRIASLVESVVKHKR